jgi:hypothetical protein
MELGAGILDQVIRSGIGWAEVSNAGVFYLGCQVWLHNQQMQPKYYGFSIPMIVKILAVDTVGKFTWWKRFRRQPLYGRIYFSTKVFMERGDYLVLPLPKETP